MMSTHYFKLPTFTPTQAEIWDTMWLKMLLQHIRFFFKRVNFINNNVILNSDQITNEQREMLKVRIALTQELRAVTAHLWTPNTADPITNSSATYENMEQDLMYRK